MAYLAQHDRQVRELDLSNFSTLHDQDLKTISKCCPNLQELLIQSKYITDQGLQHLQALTALQNLNLKECSHITDQGLQYLQILSALQSLELSKCNKITDQGLQSLKILSALKSFLLFECKQISAQQINQLASQKPKLTIRL